jgi:hypothetical protein
MVVPIDMTAMSSFMAMSVSSGPRVFPEAMIMKRGAVRSKPDGGSSNRLSCTAARHPY